MRIGILSDVHGDVHALDQALARLREMSVEMVLCAGDLLDVEPFGEEVVQRIKAESVTCIRGNHDRWALAGDAPEARAYSEGCDLSHDTLTYLARLPDHWTAELDGVRVAMWHARPGSDMEAVRPDRLGSAEGRGLLNQAGADVLVVGHTHEPFRIVEAYLSDLGLFHGYCSSLNRWRHRSAATL